MTFLWLNPTADLLYENDLERLKEVHTLLTTGNAIKVD